MIPSTIVLATTNRHKADEFQALFASHGLAVTIVPVTDVWPDYHVDETGLTFEENAYLKACAVMERTGCAVLADDSGIEADALNGRPGVFSARFAGADATDADNRSLLLSELHNVTDRRARFRCVLCYIDPLRTLFDEGTVEGTITHEALGTSGFGYDPVFRPDGHERTFAEMSANEKHALSHRGRATARLIAQLTTLATETGHATVDDALPATDALIMASVAAVTQHTAQLRSTIRHFVRTPDDAVLVYEALLQCYLFAGFPAALDALTILDNEVRSLIGQVQWPAATPYDVPLFTERGTALCGTVYQGVMERMMQRLGAITPDLASWMIVEGYGKTLARPGLSVVDRELCIAAILAALGREQQLYSHVRGALNVGGTEAQLRACADIVFEHCGTQAGITMERTIDAVVRTRT